MCVNEQAFDVEIRRSQSRADTVASQPRSGAALLPPSSVANNSTAPTATVHKDRAGADARSDGGAASKFTTLRK